MHLVACIDKVKWKIMIIKDFAESTAETTFEPPMGKQ
jgi:hypothetical protein